MRVLLARAWQRKVYSRFFRGIFYYRYTDFPVSLGYTAALLEQDGHEVAVHDGFISGSRSNGNLRQKIKEFAPEAIVLSSGDLPEWNCPVPTNEFIVGAARAVRRVFDGPLALSGPHLNVQANRVLEEVPDCVAVVSEPETITRELVRRLAGAESTHDVQGTAHLEDGRLVQAPPAPMVDLDMLPLPAYHLFPMDRYTAINMEGTSGRQAAIETSRGCPFQCTFCYRGTHNSYRVRPDEKVLEQIDILLDRYDVTLVNFSDLEFILSKPKAESFLQAMIDRGYGKRMRWWCQTRVDSVTPQLLALMKEAGCHTINYGVESGNEGVLEGVKKGITKDQIVEAVAQTRALGIRTHLNLTTGFPGDSRETYDETWRFFEGLNPDFISGFAFAIPYPGTELHRRAVASGRLVDGTWKEIRANTGRVDNDFGRLDVIWIMLLHTYRARMYSLRRYFGRWFPFNPQFWRWLARAVS